MENCFRFQEGFPLSEESLVHRSLLMLCLRFEVTLTLAHGACRARPECLLDCSLSHTLSCHFKGMHIELLCFCLGTHRASKVSGFSGSSSRWSFVSQAKWLFCTLTSKDVVGSGPSASHFTIFVEFIFSLCVPF